LAAFIYAHLHSAPLHSLGACIYCANPNQPPIPYAAMLNPFVELFADLIQLYMFCVVAWTVLYTLISFKIVNTNQNLIMSVMYALNRLCMPVLRRIRKFMPNLGAIDISPIILLLLLEFLRNCLYRYFYNL